MEEQRVSFEVAKLAAQVGYDWSDKKIYNTIGQLWDAHYPTAKNSDIESGMACVAPTQSLLQKWLRDIHDIKIFIDYQPIGSDDYEYCYKIMYEEGNAKRQYERTKTIESLNDWGSGYNNVYPADTYEQVLEAALKKALELIKP